MATCWSSRKTYKKRTPAGVLVCCRPPRKRGEHRPQAAPASPGPAGSARRNRPPGGLACGLPPPQTSANLYPSHRPRRCPLYHPGLLSAAAPGRRPPRLRRGRRAPPAETALRAVSPAAVPLHPQSPKKDPPAENSVGGMVCRWEQVPCGPFTSRCAVGAPEGYAVVPSPEVPEAAGLFPPLSPPPSPLPPSPPSPPGVGGVGGVGWFCCRAARSCCSCSSVLPAGL